MLVTIEEIVEMINETVDYENRYRKDCYYSIRTIINHYFKLDNDDMEVFERFLLDELRTNKYNHSHLSILIIQYAKITKYCDEIADIYMEVSESYDFHWRQNVILTILRFGYNKNLKAYDMYYKPKLFISDFKIKINR